MKRLPIYTASKLDLAPFWKALRGEWTEFEFTARWIDHHLDAEFDPKVCRRFWIEDVEDITRAAALIVYGREQDKLRGALVEAGVALAQSKPVFVIGEHADYGTWQYHPLVVRCSSIEDVRRILHLYGDLYD